VSRVSPTPARVAHAVALAASLAALAFTLGGPGALAGPFALLVLPAFAVPFFEWRSVPPTLQRALPRLVVLRPARW
jgi:hypothetical protein